MASPYTSVTVNNYNANPPSDDGSESPENRVNWSTIKSKLADTLKVAVDSIDDNVLAAFAKILGAGDVVSTAITYEVAASNQGDLIRTTASAVTITTPDATVVGSPFSFGLLNSASGSITLDGNGSQTVNGSSSITVPSGDGYMVFTDGSNWFVIGRKTGVLPRGYIDGCLLSNGTDTTNDINIAPGECRDSTNAVDIAVAAMSGKQLDANWAPGAAAGMRNSAAGITNATYHIYAVAKADGTQDIYAHTSTTVATVITALQAETGGADYIYARLIGSIIRVSSTIKAFLQVNDYFWWDIPSLDKDGATITTNTPFAITVPLGVRVHAIFNASPGANNVSILFSSPEQTSATPSLSSGQVGSIGNETANQFHGQQMCLTNTSAQIKPMIVGTVSSFNLSTLGFIHPRGRNA